MTDEERAYQAQRLLDSPLMKEFLDYAEEVAIEGALEARKVNDYSVQLELARLETIRGFRGFLLSTIEAHQIAKEAGEGT